MNRSRRLLFTTLGLALSLTACDLTGSGDDKSNDSDGSGSSTSSSPESIQQCKQRCFDHRCQSVSGCTAVASCVAGCNGDDSCLQECGDGASSAAIQGSNDFYECSNLCDIGFNSLYCVDTSFAGCQQDATCASLYSCLSGCSDQSCANSCANASTSDAVDLYTANANQVGVCICNSCVNVCDSDAACAQLNSCYNSCGADSDCASSCEAAASQAALERFQQASSCYQQNSCSGS